jgi:hypothetical protein
LMMILTNAIRDTADYEEPHKGLSKGDGLLHN